MCVSASDSETLCFLLNALLVVFLNLQLFVNSFPCSSFELVKFGRRKSLNKGEFSLDGSDLYNNNAGFYL